MAEQYKQIESEITQEIKTIFDSEEFDFSVDLNNAGHAIRDDLAKVYNVYARLNQLATKAKFMYKQQELKTDKVESLAWNQIYKDPEKNKMKVSTQKIIVLTEVIEIDGEKTSLIKESEKLLLYEYVANRARDKKDEIIALLDLGRSILSWDKAELEKLPT